MSTQKQDENNSKAHKNLNTAYRNLRAIGLLYGLFAFFFSVGWWITDARVSSELVPITVGWFLTILCFYSATELKKQRTMALDVMIAVELLWLGLSVIGAKIALLAFHGAVFYSLFQARTAINFLRREGEPNNAPPKGPESQFSALPPIAPYSFPTQRPLEINEQPPR